MKPKVGSHKGNKIETRLARQRGKKEKMTHITEIQHRKGASFPIM